MISQHISDKCTVPSKTIPVLDSEMHYLEAGTGSPILFLHGIPASSYLWRNIIPHLSSLGRCIAPDLIGCGESGKPAITYSIHEHIKYINAFIKALNLKQIILVTHGLGSIIGCHYLEKHPDNCKGIVLYEAFLDTPTDDEAPLAFDELTSTWQSHIDTSIVDRLFLQLTTRKLNRVELDHYRKPFSTANSLQPIQQFIKELASGHQDPEISKLISDYTKALSHSTLPKLMLYSVPGFITTIATVMWAKQHLSNLEVADVGEELHFGQESNPDLIGETISVWLQGLEQAA